MISIYCIRNKATGRIYVGQSKNVYKLLDSHKSKLEAGTHINRYLQNSWNHCGKDTFEFKVLKSEVESQQEADQLVIDMVDIHRRLGLCYNATKDEFAKERSKRTKRWWNETKE